VGKRQSLFMFHPVSPGSAFFLPHGTRVLNRLTDFLRSEYRVRVRIFARVSSVIHMSIYCPYDIDRSICWRCGGLTNKLTGIVRNIHSVSFLTSDETADNKQEVFCGAASRFPQGYEEVVTPLLYNKDLWVTSGHWENYRENMFVAHAADHHCAEKPDSVSSFFL
jgi:threonyl-tRNA synthetase